MGWGVEGWVSLGSFKGGVQGGGWFGTPCTVGQISVAAGSQAGWFHIDGADQEHLGGARQSRGGRG